MPRFQIITVRDRKHLENCLNYVGREDHNLTGSLGTFNYLPFDSQGPGLYGQTMRMLDFHQPSYKRYGLHLIIQFSVEEDRYLNPEKLLMAGYHIAQTYFSPCMSCFGVHTNTDLIHLHYMLMPYSIYDGHSIGISKQEWWKMMNDLKSYMSQYMGVPPEAVGDGSICFGIEK